MPTDPTARDVETARALSPCIGYPCGTLDTWVEEMRRCPACVHADAIARALATARAEEREAKDGAYRERNYLVAALSKLFPASVEHHDGEGWQDDWRHVVYIDLPTGQASWHIHDSEVEQFAHLPRGQRRWDGHDTATKYARLAAIRAARSAS